VGVSALDAVYRLLDQHPEWKISLRGGDIFVKNGFDRKGTNDAFYINPGTWVPGAVSRDRVELRDQKITLGGSNVQLVQWGNGHWQMLVKGQPYLIRGICYSPSPVGKTPDWGGFKPHSDWMNADTDNNKRADGPFDAWVDENLNNQRDDNEKAVGDFALMRDMGVNTVRLYHHGESKELLRTLEREYGIRVVMGDFLGAYTIGSDAEWDMGTDYTDPAQLEKMRASVRQMVTDHKDESYVLMWVLGNENNYGAGNNAPKQLAAYYQFVDSVAKMIREMDPTRPVAICNGDLENLDLLAANCPNVDVLAVNAYRGSYGMGESFWRAAARVWKKPVMISEFGCPAFNKNAPEKALTEQADYLVSNWNDIEAHIAGRRLGNSLGGVLFEWTDEWWKAGAETMVSEQDREPQSHGPFPDGNMYEEWLGLTSQGDGKSSPYMRQLRPAYFAFKNGPWKRDQKQAWKR
jgi:beta-glucuronidase